MSHSNKSKTVYPPTQTVGTHGQPGSQQYVTIIPQDPLPDPRTATVKQPSTTKASSGLTTKAWRRKELKKDAATSKGENNGAKGNRPVMKLDSPDPKLTVKKFVHAAWAHFLWLMNF
jgi:hypothetical protein